MVREQGMSFAVRGASAGQVLGKILLWGILLVPALYLSTCSYISHHRSTGFELVRTGDTEDLVIDKLGNPSVRERSGAKPFLRYASYGCVAPCAERLWFENRLSLDAEAWSVDLDANRRVIDKAKWISP